MSYLLNIFRLSIYIDPAIDAHTIDSTRNEQDFVEHIKKTVNISPDSQWVFVSDQLNTHKSETLVRWVAEQCEIKQELGIKGTSGILNLKSSVKPAMSQDQA